MKQHRTDDQVSVAEVLADEDAAAEDLTPEQLAAQWEAEGPPPGGRMAALGSTLVVTVLAAAAALLSLRMGLGTPQQPAPGMWPFVVSVVAVVIGLAHMVLGRRGGEGEKFTRESLLAAYGLVSLVGLVLLMPVIGFEIPALLLSFIWMKFLGGETWRAATLYSVLVVVAFYLIFITALGTSIPHLF
ncbi:tripartite tricarboxylate transporter TctB family protein [Kocuria sp. M1N1S27]|uniref:tripartite tricarboxylate transporter TctB family protein n=1 Tax=Kocuria kalidii TaxID=3376283 RepID=UPI003797734E